MFCSVAHDSLLSKNALQQLSATAAATKKNGAQALPHCCRRDWTPLSVAGTGPPLGAMRYTHSSANAVPSRKILFNQLFYMIFHTHHTTQYEPIPCTVAVHQWADMH
jgi:hypothetical protein